MLLLTLPSAANARGAGSTDAPTEGPNLPRIERWASHIREASARFGIPERWIRRVMRAESGGRTTLDGRPITSRAGAMGLMQLMPGTWAEMRAMHGLGPDPHDPRDNILAGAAYLRAMYDRFGHPGLFAAYNAGPARYAEHLTGRRKLPAETFAYVADIGAMPDWSVTAAFRQGPAQSGIFVRLHNARHSPWESHSVTENSGGLFVRLALSYAEHDIQ